MDPLFTVQLAVTQRILNTTVSIGYAQSRGPLCQTAFGGKKRSRVSVARIIICRTAVKTKKRKRKGQLFFLFLFLDWEVKPRSQTVGMGCKKSLAVSLQPSGCFPKRFVLFLLTSSNLSLSRSLIVHMYTVTFG